MELPAINTFPGRLKYLRVLRGLTQYTLAMRLPVPTHEMTISKWERGETEPRPTRLAQLAQALGVSVPWLAEGTGATPT